jgi:hypothetical protein
MAKHDIQKSKILFLLGWRLDVGLNRKENVRYGEKVLGPFACTKATTVAATATIDVLT